MLLGSVAYSKQKMPACLCCPPLSAWVLYSKWNKLNDGFTQSYLQNPVKSITLLFLLQEKRELLCLGLQQHQSARGCLVGRKCNRKDFCSVIQSRTDLYQLSSVWLLFCLSGVLSIWSFVQAYYETKAGKSKLVSLATEHREVTEPGLGTFPGEAGGASRKFLYSPWHSFGSQALM